MFWKSRYTQFIYSFALLKRFFLNFSLKLMNVDNDPLIKGYEKSLKRLNQKY